MKAQTLCLFLLASCGATATGTSPAPAMHATGSFAATDHHDSIAYLWVDIMLEASASDVELFGARPTILSRQMAIPVTAIYDAWAAYDDAALTTTFGDELRRPRSERSHANRACAISYAAYRTLLDQFPEHHDFLTAELRDLGFDPDVRTTDPSTPAGLGNLVAATLLAERHADGANQLGDEPGSACGAYSDYTMYRPANTADEIRDPDRWQPIEFTRPDGTTHTPGFLTPHWYRVRPFALETADAFRPGPPPLADTAQMRTEVDECLHFNATLDPEDKALVEFMRDGPRSTAQSGHWLKFAQAVSRRDRHDLERDVKIFFVVGNVAMDTFIAAWDAKRFYDSSRPWTLVRHLYAGEDVQGWGGPGEGVVSMPAEQWHPYSPQSFITPPFPGYVSGHSTVSAGCAEALRLFTGSDRFNETQDWSAGDLTEPGFTCQQIQKREGRAHTHRPGETCDVTLIMPTFTEAAELAGISRVMGGYHIQADNVAGLKLGRDVARATWSTYLEYFQDSRP